MSPANRAGIGTNCSGWFLIRLSWLLRARYPQRLCMRLRSFGYKRGTDLRCETAALASIRSYGSGITHPGHAVHKRTRIFISLGLPQLRNFPLSARSRKPRRPRRFQAFGLTAEDAEKISSFDQA